MQTFNNFFRRSLTSKTLRETMARAIHVGQFIADGNVQPSQVNELVRVNELKGWLSLTGGYKDCVKQIKYDEVVVDGKLDSEANRRVVQVLDELPRPTMIQGSSDISQTVLLYYLAKKQGLDREAAQILANNLGIEIQDQSIFQQMTNSLVKDNLIFRQLFESESSTYTYLLADSDTQQGVLIDPVYETVDRDLAIINDLGVNVLYAINTHCHADHITGTGKLKKTLSELKSGIAKASGAKADFYFEDGDEIKFGQHSLKVLSTPGHTDGCVCFYTTSAGGMIFTGDAVLIRACGRTDFQQGSPETLFDSVHGKVFTLPEETAIYPGHDYKGRTRSSVGEEKRLNPRLTKSKPEFANIMNNLGLAYPKKIDVSLPANLVDGETHVE
eukprot:TRINITY_DN4355_c0_g1_i4.p1 TRINITY_DN4355_c0_g1~~TRINITY_DN4355_c0_g1_i4.p1  ORF type:complete len:403 (-),score=40.02 TRINITY_DN4355_c0_g1_i4:143-1300(-)